MANSTKKINSLDEINNVLEIINIVNNILGRNVIPTSKKFNSLDELNNMLNNLREINNILTSKKIKSLNEIKNILTSKKIKSLNEIKNILTSEKTSSLNEIKNVREKTNAYHNHYDSNIHTVTDINNTNIKDVISKVFKDEEAKETKEKPMVDMLKMESIRYDNLPDDPKTASKKAFLWLATKEGCAPIYIFGSIHLGSPMVRDFFEDVLKLYVSKVKTVFTEIDYGDPEKLPGILCLDQLVYKLGSQMGKNCKALESDEVRAKIIPKYAKLIEAIDKMLKNISSEELISDFECYLTDISVCSYGADPYYSTQRNVYWMNTIRAESQSHNPALVVCGTAHNYGRYGLPSLLQKEGYKLQPVIDKCPTPRSSILRVLAGFEGNFTFFNKPQVYEVKNENLCKENPCRDIVPYGSI